MTDTPLVLEMPHEILHFVNNGPKTKALAGEEKEKSLLTNKNSSYKSEYPTLNRKIKCLFVLYKLLFITGIQLCTWVFAGT